MKNTRCLALVVTSAGILVPKVVYAQASTACTVTGSAYTEAFSTSTYKDPNSSVSGWPSGGATLPYKAGGFPKAAILAQLNERVYAISTGDFNGDKLDDILALSDAGGGCHLELFVNVASNTNAAFTSKQTVATCSGTLATGAPVMAVGDVDGDGLLDFVVATVSVPSQAGTVATAQYYHNNGLTSGYPTFGVTDISGILTAQAVSWHASGTQLALRDVDYDGRADLVVFTSSGSSNQVLAFSALTAGLGNGFNATPSVLIANTNLQTNIASSTVPVNCGYNCDPNVNCTGSKGGTAMAVADLNGDTYQDIVVGSVSENKLYIFLANSDGSYALNGNMVLAAPLLAYAADVDGGGAPDLLVLQSGNDCNGPPSYGALFYNGGQANFTQYGRTLPVGGTAQFGGVMDVDGDGYKDVLAGKVTGIGQFSFYQNVVSTSTYNIQGTALSKSVVSLNPSTQAAVSVTVSAYTATVPSGTTLSMYVSNDGGLDWEALTATELTGTEHTFTHFGADVRWKAVFTATASTLSAAQAIYAPGSTSTPQLTRLAFTVNVVGQASYTRSGLAHAKFTYNGSPLEMLYSAAFSYPGFSGKLYAYNITGLAPGSTATGAAARVDTDSSVTLAWEAGTLLAGRTGGARTLYTAYPASTTSDPVTVSDTLLPFTVAQATGGSSTPSLATMMNITALNTVQRTTLMNWLASGMGDPNGWKLFDPGHSTPVFVGPPAADANYMGAGYSNFITSNANRTPVVLLGANDGFLHAFHAATGVELWAFVPYNLLSKLKTQQYTDPNGNTHYVHQSFIDGRITVQDVYRNSTWYTVAVVGEADGTGMGGNNYYFALDITDPTNPKALWEFSDTWATPHPPCLLTNNSVTNCSYTCTPSTVCRSECSTYDSYMSVNSSNPANFLAGSPYGCIEAEHFDTETGSTPAGSDWFIETSIGGARNGNYISTPNTSVCIGGSQANVAGCTMLSFRVNNGTGSTQTLYPYFLTYPTGSSNQNLSWGLDGIFKGTTALSGAANAWNWQYAGASLSLPVGDHTLNLWMNQTSVHVDALTVQKNQLTAAQQVAYLAPASAPPETCMSVCEQTCTGSCTTQTYTANASTPWPQCGTGANLTCCGQTGGDQYCAPVGTCAQTPESIMGKTYSPPAIGRVNTTGGDKWVAMFGSGYNNRVAAPNVGRDVYAVDAYTGALMGHWNFGDIPFSGTNVSTIDNTIAGGVSMADVDNDGFVDRAYFGDLEGRLWKINMSKQISLTGGGAMTTTDYPTCVVFDAGNPNQTGTRVWAPIVTTPAVATLAAGTANIYFGTGGDDRAPDTNLYKFYAIRDSDSTSQCQTLNRTQASLTITNLEWAVGDGLTNGATKTTLASPSDEGTVGDRYWSDPVISNGTTVYFASLPGKIESVDPCIDMQGTSKIFGYAIQDSRDGTGIFRAAGTTVLGVPWIASLGKVRTAALIRNAPTQTNVPHGASNPVTQAKSDVFLQNFSGTTAGDRPAIQRITEGGNQVSSRLRLLRWREVPL